MSQEISILIVEDEVLIAQDLKEILEEVGYTEIFKARNYNQAIDALNAHAIDIILLDINLNDTKSGIDLGNHIHQNLHTPFIYITSYSDAETIASVKQTKPSAFLLKPYNKAHLLASIEIALFNYSSNLNAAEKNIEDTLDDTSDNDLIINNQLLIKDNYHFIKISLDDIFWFESDKNYVTVNTLHKKYLLRASLKKLQANLPANKFVKCNKQFIVNIQQAESFSSNAIVINGNEIAISRTEQAEVLKRLKL
jgi:DNA-binding LytR/AlgR family response regulator